eukprot:10357380-Heterocapsa_arctica.AAC.1
MTTLGTATQAGRTGPGTLGPVTAPERHGPPLKSTTTAAPFSAARPGRGADACSSKTPAFSTGRTHRLASAFA